MTTKRAAVAVDNYPAKIELFRDAFSEKDWIIKVEEGPGLTVEMFNFYVTINYEDIGRLAHLCRRLNIKARGLRN